MLIRKIPHGLNEMDKQLDMIRLNSLERNELLNNAVVELLEEASWRMQQMIIQDMDDAMGESEVYNNAIDDCCETVKQMIIEWESRHDQD